MAKTGLYFTLSRSLGINALVAMKFCLLAPIPRPESGVFKVRPLSLGSSLPHWPGSYNITFEHAEEAKMRAVDWIPGILPFVGGF